MKLLTINPGSTSTKIGVFEDDRLIFDKVLCHKSEELAKYQNIYEQFDFRYGIILSEVKAAGHDISEFDAIVGRGGLLRPIEGGTYEVNDSMLNDLKKGIQGEHVCNLGGIIAREIAQAIGKPAYIVDPGVVDELADISRVTGHPLFKKHSLFHALNHKAIARQYCGETGKRYEDINLIVAHMGGGISIGIHEKGRVIDANNGLIGEGPFSPERSGALPAGEVVSICFSGKYTQSEVNKMLKGAGGMVAYFNSNDMKELEKRSKTDGKVKLVLDAMIYQIAKEIASFSAAVNGNVDAILLTGGLCYSDYISDSIAKRVSFIAEVRKYPGEDELRALAQGALRVLRGEEKAKIY